MNLSIGSFKNLLLAWLASACSLSAGSAAVSVTETDNRLSLDTGAITLRLNLNPDGGVLLESLRLRNSDLEFAAQGQPTGINLSLEILRMTGFAADAGFEQAGHQQRSTVDGGTALEIRLRHRPSKLLATMIITAHPNSAVLDWCARLENGGDSVISDISRCDSLSVALPSREKPYRAYWVTRNEYALHQAEVKEALTVDGGNWNGPNAAGWLALEDPAHGTFLVAGIEWERHWAFEMQPTRVEGAYRLSAGLTRGSTVSLAPGQRIESPHVFLGLAKGDLDDAANLTHQYLQEFVLPPSLPGFPFVCYDIWSTEGLNVEQRILDEARFAAQKLGVEVFYQDASWYRDSDVSNHERWGVGLGSYSEDRRKLPNGLAALADAVHGLGMKFGLWVCPEMVDVKIMEREGIPNQWMTIAQGKYNIQAIGGWNPMKMLCLGDPEVEAHLRKKLLGIVDRFHLDWLKWDASGLPGLDIVCDRADHGHQAGNGSQAAVFGKYRVLDSLHEQHPDLILEQCSYGTRLDYGMGRHGARVNWLSDSTAPSSHVRENVMAAAYALPSSCNMAWVMRDQEVSQSQTPEFLDTLFRSRMMGSFGFGTLHGSLSECVSLYPPAVIDAAARNVGNYKRYRHLLSQNEYHLTPWKSGHDWQAMQFAARNHDEGVGFFFRNGSSNVVRRFKIRGLAPDKEYEVASFNAGSSKAMTGIALSEAGVEINLDRDPQASEILWFQAATRSKR